MKQNVLTPSFAEPVVNRPAETSKPSHLVSMYGEEWTVWKWFCLRGAGFPAHLVEKLAAPRSVAAAAELANTRITVKASISNSAFLVRQVLSSTDEQRAAKRLHRLLRTLNQGRIPGNISELPPGTQNELLAAQLAENKAAAKFKAEFQSEITRISNAIRETANDDSFQRALLLQNPRAIRHIQGAFRLAAVTEPKRGFKDRQNEELIASYIQRYCVKNDTIGFFGPVGWARLVSGGDAITSRPGPCLIKQSSMYFEHWGIEALADKISANEILRPWIAPRRSPYFYLDGNNLCYPNGRSLNIAPMHAAVLEACDGERTAREIALELMKLTNSNFHAESEVYAILRQLAERHIIAWKFELPLEACAEQRLRSALFRIEPEELRSSALAKLDELENARLRVAAASTNAQTLDASLQSLEETFIRLTGQETSRAAGKMYAGRTLIYNDCRRDLQLEIGPPLLKELGPPLSLILTSARWFTYRAAELYREAFLLAYRGVATKSKASQVTALQLWMAVQGLIFDPQTALLKQVLKELQNSWQKLLDVPWDASRVEYQSGDLRDKVSAVFNAVQPGWSTAIYHSPDIMIAASDADSIRAGNYFLVLGELHLAVHTLRGSLFMLQHPCPEEMYAAMEHDVPAPHIFPVPRSSWPGLTTRTAISLIPDNHLLVEASPESFSPAERSRTLPISAFVVEACGDEVIVRSRDGRLSLTAIEFFSEALSLRLADHMRILPRQPHTPRITIDRLVVSRETWRIPAAEMSFVNEAEESSRFYRMQEWRTSLNLPRFVFARISVEPKPIYVDFASPVYVEILCKMVRRVVASNDPEKLIDLSEMLPTPEQNWLLDAAEQKYTSEFRIIVVDQIATRSAAASVQRCA